MTRRGCRRIASTALTGPVIGTSSAALPPNGGELAASDAPAGGMIGGEICMPVAVGILIGVGVLSSGPGLVPFIGAYGLRLVVRKKSNTVSRERRFQKS